LRFADGLREALAAAGICSFNSEIDLESQGTAGYKQAIDDALDAARVLVAVGTRREHLESRWVRYEWDGFTTTS